eukprot:6184559-Pleurochrysis_carterae.AAC.8
MRTRGSCAFVSQEKGGRSRRSDVRFDKSCLDRCGLRSDGLAGQFSSYAPQLSVRALASDQACSYNSSYSTIRKEHFNTFRYMRDTPWARTRPSSSKEVCCTNLAPLPAKEHPPKVTCRQLRVECERTSRCGGARQNCRGNAFMQTFMICAWPPPALRRGAAREGSQSLSRRGDHLQTPPVHGEAQELRLRLTQIMLSGREPLLHTPILSPSRAAKAFLSFSLARTGRGLGRAATGLIPSARKPQISGSDALAFKKLYDTGCAASARIAQSRKGRPDRVTRRKTGWSDTAEDLME